MEKTLQVRSVNSLDIGRCSNLVLHRTEFLGSIGHFVVIAMPSFRTWTLCVQLSRVNIECNSRTFPCPLRLGPRGSSALRSSVVESTRYD